LKRILVAGNLTETFFAIRKLAEKKEAPKGIELLQARQCDRILLIGMPGTRVDIEFGRFPPKAEPKANDAAKPSKTRRETRAIARNQSRKKKKLNRRQYLKKLAKKGNPIARARIAQAKKQKLRRQQQQQQQQQLAP